MNAVNEEDEKVMSSNQRQLGSPIVESPDLFRNVFDFLKHMTTLSTGSIVLVTALVNGLLPNHPTSKVLVAVALVGFVISITASMIAFHSGLLMYPGRFQDPRNDTEQHHRDKKVSPLLNVAGLAILAAWLGFLVGIISIAAFALLNL